MRDRWQNQECFIFGKKSGNRVSHNKIQRLFDTSTKNASEACIPPPICLIKFARLAQKAAVLADFSASTAKISTSTAEYHTKMYAPIKGFSAFSPN